MRGRWPSSSSRKESSSLIETAARVMHSSSKREEGGVFSGATRLCRAIYAQFDQLLLWCFGQRIVLDGGMVVCRGRVLAEGGFSFVYSGVVSQSGRQVVLKRVSSDDLERTRREIQAHRRYDHPNLMPLLDSCVSGSVAWMVFPLCADGSLRDAIDAKVVESAAPPWSPADFSKLFEGTCRGLAAMHASGFAHRDIKPENVLIAEGCRPVLMDFGSVAEAKVSVETRRETLVLQDEAAAHSTMPYRAPELWQPEVCPGGGVIDTAKSDVWALGCLLWAMAYGYSPFESDFPSGSKTPRIVPPSHLRTLAKPGLPPKDALGTRHEPEFFARVLSSSLELLVVDHNERPDIHRALDLAVSLSTGPL